MSVTDAPAAPLLPYQDTSLPFEVRAADLVSRMTLAEKAEQLRSTNPPHVVAPAIPRLGVKAFTYWNEALHGVARAAASGTLSGSSLGVTGEATEFPTGLGLASSWNPTLVAQTTKVTSDEGRAYWEDPANADRRWGLTWWSPTINMHRDPRWGRAEETYGEDPYLAGQIGGAFTAGLQGATETNGGYLKSVATPKHYLANNSENNRHDGSSNLTEAELREYYTPAFETLWKDYGAASGMTSYNAVNGIPQSANTYTVETLARRTFGFDGFITSDCGAIDDVTDAHVEGNNDGHAWAPAIVGRALTRAEGTAWSLKAGTDVDCNGTQYAPNIIPAIQQGLITENELNINLTRAFTVRMRLGEFDASTPWSSYNLSNQISTSEHRAVAKQASQEGVVLLKNDGILPLAASDTNVVLLGEFGDELVHGDYSPTTVPADLVNRTVKVALEDKLGAANVTYSPAMQEPGKPAIGGLQFFSADPDVPPTPTAIGAITAQQMQATGTAVLDGYEQGATIWGGGFRSFVGVGDAIEGYVEFTGTIPAGTQYIRLQQYGGPPTPGGYYDIQIGASTATLASVGTTPQSNVGETTSGYSVIPSTTAAINLGSPTAAAQTVRIRIQYRNATPVGSFLGANAQPALISAVSSADAVIAYVGTRTSTATKSSDSAEEQDRKTIALPRFQSDIAHEACALNPNTIVWIQAVGQVDTAPFQNCKAIIWTTYNGEYQADTVPEVLWGDVNPSGKLPFTYYEDPVRDLRETTDYTLTPTDGRLGRTYQYFTGPVTYPFGHGLSYSTFTYSNLVVSKTAVTPNDSITVSVNVTNNSSRAGKEVIQLYATSPKAGDPLRADKQLKGFQKVEFAANETKTITIPLDIADLWFWDSVAGKRTYDVGAWTLQVGTSSVVDPVTAHNGLTTTINLSGTLAPALDVVTVVPDGTTLNTAAPGNVIHANLSATRTDQSFYDLSAVTVTYTSSNPAVAQVDANGAVAPISAGVAQITAAVTADGSTKSDTFPVVVYDGAYVSDDATHTVIQAEQVRFPDQTVTLGDAKGGYQLLADLVPAAWGAEYTYSIAPMDTNTAGASVTSAGVLTAAKAGQVRVTVVSVRDGVYQSAAATITVTAGGASASDPATVRGALASLLVTPVASAGYTAPSYAAYEAALQAAKAVLANPNSTAEQLQAALTNLSVAIASLVPVAQASAPTQLSSVTVTAAAKAWTGKKISSGFTLTVAGKKLVVGTDYTITSTGANKAIGKGTVTITGKGAYAGTKTVTFKILPKKLAAPTLTVGKKQLKVAWKKASAAQAVTGYRITYRVKGTTAWKSKTVAKSKASLVIKKLTKGKTYQVRVQSYKTVSKVKYYSPVSAVKTSKKVK
ncbi:MAG: glycoside hydrolase family 3 C-terminal domain-containing protein [Propionibacteriaceae bacterium]|nr:glycoside hydrolase family 3 C-terminal domain-containing protein [Propionibacteriaceae bacterium]